MVVTQGIRAIFRGRKRSGLESTEEGRSLLRPTSPQPTQFTTGSPVGSSIGAGRKRVLLAALGQPVTLGTAVQSFDRDVSARQEQKVTIRTARALQKRKLLLQKAKAIDQRRNLRRKKKGLDPLPESDRVRRFKTRVSELETKLEQRGIDPRQIKALRRAPRKGVVTRVAITREKGTGRFVRTIRL